MPKRCLDCLQPTGAIPPRIAAGLSAGSCSSVVVSILHGQKYRESSGVSSFDGLQVEGLTCGRHHQPAHRNLRSRFVPVARAASDMAQRRGGPAPRGGLSPPKAAVAVAQQRSVPARDDLTCPLPLYTTDPFAGADATARLARSKERRATSCKKPDWHQQIQLFLHHIAKPSRVAFRGVRPSEPRFSGTLPWQTLLRKICLTVLTLDLAQNRIPCPCGMGPTLSRLRSKWTGCGNSPNLTIRTVRRRGMSSANTERNFCPSCSQELLDFRAVIP